ncbi:TerB family tellurite resistance protein [Alloprevotella rava]|uniref:Putative tellurite resistance protein B-like protein n=1 Tax=Alloprevotella rava TaxID=671218 RepID=A0A7W5Y0L8_9BACT|nr:TerB family tellurite resistance protein [Alloprevotella rava]MBB3701665.1 putative tellurite resistance protein B-like protein [Alloprevotella rava]
MTFTGEEMTAIIKMAKLVVMADGRLDPSETIVMATELIRFGVPQDHLKLLIESSDEIEESHAVALITGMDEERKKYVASYLAMLMVADGEIDAKELALWKLISTLCSLPTMSIAQAINNMKNL